MKEQFKKYESIANDNNTRTIEYYKEQGFTNPDILWYATEKIHGTNFSFISDGETVIHAQRGGIIEDNFMNCNAFVHKLDAKVEALARYIGQPIQVVCEYYGKGIINKGAIQYRNDDEKDFIAYDILLLNDNKFVSYPNNMDLFYQFDIPNVAVLAEGTFEQLMEIHNVRKSYLAELNGVDTYAEGMVLKPYDDIRLNTEAKERVVLKRVSEQFAENRPRKVEKAVGTIDDATIQLIDSKNTEIRLGKIAAKIGILPSEKNKFAQLIIELANDIQAEIQKESSNTVDVNIIKKQLTTMVKSYFV